MRGEGAGEGGEGREYVIKTLSAARPKEGI